ncbi:sugar ABC transporter substrate-binding protein [Cohnella sp. CIP 111063]|uniref:FecCD family ABC transporter permease n=1 Tax=unclassified Cohnella TaxID=2636738 RepID=UPI000B8C653C|nr:MULTISPECIES: iron ABC transporter permease [unclassified Cohnella]OXS62291.1 sugar ABC transporter substrate-binding protein [Cohnella sp. CIP 111063]PRX74522.1 ABC-type Fe3+-siderophore transport system permease subunit [Cohnella sp. SGD-V74]
MRKSSIAIIAGLLVFLLAGAVLSMNLGKMALSPFEVFTTLFGKGTANNELVLFEFRLPRIALAVLVGVGMAASGTVLQGLLRNDLADPGILGISAGSGLVVLVFISILGADGLSSAIMLPLLAFIGGLFAAFLIYLFSYRKGAFPSPTRLILTGVAINVGLGAVSLFLTLKLDENQYAFAQKWQAGYLWGDKWVYIAILAPWVLLLFGYAWYKSRTLNTIGMGYEVATGVGVSVNKAFVSLTLTAVAIASGSVALGGSIFFIGLISPHIARKLVGSDHKVLLPAAGIIGGMILLASDTIVRTASFAMGIPAGVIVTIVSVPYFLYLLIKAS